MSPAQSRPGNTEPSLPGEAQQPRRPRANVLLVDDREENLVALETILAPLRQTLVRASSGEKALHELARRDFAVVLLDVHMPAMDGLETARRVSARARTPSVPIVFLTQRDQDPSRLVEGYRPGVADYLAKPFQPGMVRSKVALFVGMWRGKERIRELEEAIREARQRDLGLMSRVRAAEIEAESAAGLLALNTELEAGIVVLEGRVAKLSATNAELVGLSAINAELEGRIAGLERRIAELSELNTDLGRRAAETERTIAARARDYFSMGNELRTPINAVFGYSTLLLDNLYGPLTPQQRGGLERTQLAAQQLLELVDSMLDRFRTETSSQSSDGR
ncbi:hypothetical protein BH23GEM2_BH23GEM2_23700 [soil metagenome]